MQPLNDWRRLGLAPQKDPSIVTYLLASKRSTLEHIPHPQLPSDHTFNQSTSTMPVHPSEEETPMGITEKIAKDPSSMTESTASDHEHHENEHTPHQSAKASAQDFQSKGPQILMTMKGIFLLAVFMMVLPS